MNDSQKIDNHIKELSDWRGELIGKIRKLIHSAAPEIEEVWKWETPVFAFKGNVCALGSFKDKVKLNFFKGVQLKDSSKLINSGLDSKSHRSIDFYEDYKLNESALKDLIKQAVNLNI